MKIKFINDSSLYGTIIECGTSTAITSQFLNISGASKTIFRSEQPYSKEIQKKYYPGDYKRSVSREFIKEVILTEMDLHNENNFVLVTSFQVAEDNAITHGWIGLFHDNIGLNYFHYTFPSNTTRTELLEDVGKIGVELLYQLAEQNHIYNISKLDTLGIMDQAYIHDDINYELLLTTKENNIKDYFLVFEKDTVIRFEELMRRGDEFIINKGSFDPLHEGHVTLLENSKKEFQNAQTCFLISANRYDKPDIGWKELVERIETITKLGYTLIICKEMKFYTTFIMLRNRTDKTKKFYFPIGVDTLNRIYQTDYDNSGKESSFVARVFIDGMKRIFSERFKFILFKRIGYELREECNWYDSFLIIPKNDIGLDISSTKIRNGEITNKLLNEQNS